MQIPTLAGREIDDRDNRAPGRLQYQRGAGANYLGTRKSGGPEHTLPDEKRDLEIVGVSANCGTVV